MTLPRTEKMVMTVLTVFVLGVNYLPCTGFPVYDYDSSSLREALRASVAKVNSQSLSPYLFRAFRSSLKRVNVLDQDSLNMDLEFGIRETTCRRDSGEDPASCDFQRGYYVQAAVCRSTVRVSAEEVQDVWVRCRWSSSSESNSSEEMFLGDILESFKWRNNYLRGSLRGILPPGNRGYPSTWHRLQE
ncbi:secreted phosphoprotein 24 isoform X1 [Ursus maritimus]|uniref:Secreted phosphoprotein 24 n=1 Tax=Ursus maritimus TaxID=29073 RepID=A0A384C118_URSMA|nr:secreted phosphoprotein 24 isoform X1 [Ursus maritimus]XP_040494691.1 secreted phosphoprotein 24 isoform X1 [Ursus maritimus]